MTLEIQNSGNSINYETKENIYVKVSLTQKHDRFKNLDFFPVRVETFQLFFYP